MGRSFVTFSHNGTGLYYSNSTRMRILYECREVFEGAPCPGSVKSELYSTLRIFYTCFSVDHRILVTVGRGDEEGGVGHGWRRRGCGSQVRREGVKKERGRRAMRNLSKGWATFGNCPWRQRVCRRELWTEKMPYEIQCHTIVALETQRFPTFPVDFQQTEPGSVRLETFPLGARSLPLSFCRYDSGSGSGRKVAATATAGLEVVSGGSSLLMRLRVDRRKKFSPFPIRYKAGRNPNRSRN